MVLTGTIGSSCRLGLNDEERMYQHIKKAPAGGGAVKATLATLFTPLLPNPLFCLHLVVSIRLCDSLVHESILMASCLRRYIYRSSSASNPSNTRPKLTLLQHVLITMPHALCRHCAVGGTNRSLADQTQGRWGPRHWPCMALLDPVDQSRPQPVKLSGIGIVPLDHATLPGLVMVAEIPCWKVRMGDKQRNCVSVLTVAIELSP